MKRRGGARLKKDVGLRVRELRLERGWTQEQCAERLDVSIQYLRRVEYGRTNLGLESLATLGLILKVDPVELLAVPSDRKPKRKPGRPKKV